MIGTTRTEKGQRYDVVDTTQRDRKDGTVATILHWQSACAECGAPFRFTTPAASAKFQPNRRCAKHKRPGQRVKEASHDN
jgi:hypothetical protein